MGGYSNIKEKSIGGEGYGTRYRELFFRVRRYRRVRQKGNEYWPGAENVMNLGHRKKKKKNGAEGVGNFDNLHFQG